jgi:radical SAM-linked protein
VRQIRKVRKSGFTLAPEAGTERLRQSVNKDIRDEELLRSAEWIYSNGWQTLKLYFMVGLPGETSGDVAAIGQLAKRVATVARRHGKRNTVTVSLSAFVPKPHTPFQWERQIEKEEIEERVAIVRAEIARDRNIEVKFHSPAVSELEGAFSRGDARLGGVLLRAYRLGARFDAWTETFRPEAWRQAFAEAGFDRRDYLAERDPARPLPWDFVDAGIDREFLLSERGKARSGEATPDCRSGECSACGACPPGLSNITYSSMTSSEEPVQDAGKPAAAGAKAPAGRHLLRIRYSKEGPARFLSGLEIQSLWGRSLRRAGFPVAYSEGFNPAPRLSFSPALPVGTESLAEYVEAEFSLPVAASELERKLPVFLPEGIGIVSVRHVPPGSPRLSDFDMHSTYRIDPVPPSAFPKEATPVRASEAWEKLAASGTFPVEVVREETRIAIDIKPLVSKFLMNGDGLFITIIHGTGRGVRPLDAASALLGVTLAPGSFFTKKIAAEPVPRRKR